MTQNGACQCGQVHYTISGAPLFTYACHCMTCQKRTGSAFSLGAVYPLDALAVAGEMTAFTRTSDGGDSNTRYSCAECGNIIYGVGSATPGVAKLQPGTLDDTSRVVPDVHLWTRSAQSWIVLPEGAHAFETQPDSLADVLRK